MTAWDLLTETAVLPRLRTNWLGKAYQYLETVDSTNERLKQLVATQPLAAAPHGLVMVANYQSQGRGRLQRRWLAPPGTALMLSMLLYPHWLATQAQRLTLVCSLAAVAAIAEVTGLQASIKWPNDLVVSNSGGWHKIGGILMEALSWENGRLTAAVLGMGINVNMSPAQLPATDTPASSLAIATGQPVARQALLLAFLHHFEARYAQNTAAPEKLHAAWNGRLITIGQQVTVTTPQAPQPIIGQAIGTTVDGHLRIRNRQGKEQIVMAGDITLR